MSYFIVISGKNAHLVNSIAGQLLPISQGQSYVANLEAMISIADGSPSLFWDDGESGTSHGLVRAAQDCLFNETPIKMSALACLINNANRQGVTVRVWWASNEPDACMHVPETECAAEAISLFQNQSAKVMGVGFVMHPNNYKQAQPAAVGTVKR